MLNSEARWSFSRFQTHVESIIGLWANGPEASRALFRNNLETIWETANINDYLKCYWILSEWMCERFYH